VLGLNVGTANQICSISSDQHKLVNSCMMLDGSNKYSQLHHRQTSKQTKNSLWAEEMCLFHFPLAVTKLVIILSTRNVRT